MVMIYGFLYVPLIILIIYSFNNSPLGIWDHFTFKWYEKLLGNRDLLVATRNSLLLAVTSATLATAIGTLGAVGLFRFRFKGKNFIYTLLYIVMMSPDVVMGMSFMVFFMTIKLPMGFFTLLILHITFCLPFVMITLFARLADFDKHIVEASKDLGADELSTFRYVILPMLLPAIASGWLLSFTISMDDAIASPFVNGSEFQILPLWIYSMVRVGLTPEINALCTIVFVISLIIVTFSQLILRKKP